MKFIHCADLHLDSPLLGLEQYEGAPAQAIRSATRRAFENMVALGVAEKIDFLIIAGDLFDGPWRDFNAGLYFTKQMARLHAAKVMVFIVLGNHDAKNRLIDKMPFPENVNIFSAKQAETLRLESLAVAIHGRSYSDRGVDNIVRDYPAAVPGYWNIGVLHTSLTGRDGHEAYAPCSLDDLIVKSYDYWALGHVHGREVVRDKDPVILFPGNLQGRHIREVGGKGCTLVTVEADQTVAWVHHCVDVVRWERLDVDVGGVQSYEDVLGRTDEALKRVQTEDRLLVIRLSLVGSCPIHGKLIAMERTLGGQIRAQAMDMGQDAIWIEKIEIRTQPLDCGETGGDRVDDPLSTLAQVRQELLDDENFLESLKDELRSLQKHLPTELVEGERNILSLDDPQWLAAALVRAEALAVASLLANEG